MDSVDEIVLPSFDDAFGRLIQADGPLPPFAGWHMAPQRQPKPKPAIQPLVVPGTTRPIPVQGSRPVSRARPTASSSTSRGGSTVGSKRKRAPGQNMTGMQNYPSQTPTQHQHSYQHVLSPSQHPHPQPGGTSSSHPYGHGHITPHGSSSASSSNLSVSTLLPELGRLGRASFSSEASSQQSFSFSSGGTSPDASSPGTSVGASSGSPRTPSSRGYLPLDGGYSHQSPQMIAGRSIPQPIPLNSSTPSTPTTISASIAASPVPAGTKKRRTQTGFIILRPSTNGSSLRVAASSASSFSDALDALRHRALPPEHLVEGEEDGWVGVVGAEKPLYVCPFEGCGRKYTFTSNLRRHMRRGHGLAKAGSNGAGGGVLVSPHVVDADPDAMDDDAPTPPGDDEPEDVA